MAGWIFNNCELSLETLAENIKDNKVNGAPAAFNFINCIVHYSGGPIPAKELHFSDSILDFQVRTIPPPVGILAMRQLMTADQNATISL
jgi:hypothetical protein